MSRAAIWTRVKNATNAPLHLSADAESNIVNQACGYTRHWIRGLVVVCSQDPGGVTTVTGDRQIRIKFYGKSTKGTAADIFTYYHQVDITVKKQIGQGGEINPPVYAAYQLLANFRYTDLDGTSRLHWTAANLTDTRTTVYVAFDIEPSEEQA